MKVKTSALTCLIITCQAFKNLPKGALKKAREDVFHSHVFRLESSYLRQNPIECTVTCLSKQTEQDSTKQTEQSNKAIRWPMMRRPISIIVFLAIASLIEYAVILYALALGLQDTSILQWSFQFPGTGWPVVLSVSPLLHLVPICIIVTLGFSWIYLTKRTAIKRQEIRRGRVEPSRRQKSGKKGLMWKISHVGSDYSRRITTRLSKSKIGMYLSQVSFRSASKVLVIFVAFVLLFIVLAYPQLIYHAVSDAYRTNRGLYNFVIGTDSWAKGVAQAIAPIGWVSTLINNGLLAAAPTVGSGGAGLGGLLTPLATLDNMGKYLFLQNASAWISVFIVLIIGERAGKIYSYKK